MNNFAQIAYNVGIRVGDTSSAFGLILNGYINQRYKRIFRKFNWPTLNYSYSFNTVAGQKDYILPSDFKQELYVYDSTSLRDIPRLDLEELERIYPSSLNNQGTSWKYAIYQSLDTNTPANIIKTLRFFQTPGSILTIQMPYIKGYVALVGQEDTPIIDCDDAVEYGATADAWRTKRQFQKASDFEMQYEQTIQEMIWETENDPNRVVQFRPKLYCKEELYGGDGTTYYGY